MTVNLLPALGFLCSTATALPCSYLVERYGSSKVILASSLLNAVGCAIKLLVNESFFFAIIGGMLQNIAFMFGMGSSTKLAATWFKVNQRVFAISAVIIA